MRLLALFDIGSSNDSVHIVKKVGLAEKGSGTEQQNITFAQVLLDNIQKLKSLLNTKEGGKV